MGLPWPWHLLRAPHPPRPIQTILGRAGFESALVVARRRNIKAFAMPWSGMGLSFLELGLNR